MLLIQPIIIKRRLADWLRRFPMLRWGLRLGVKLLIARHYVGAVGVVFNEAGQVLLVEHVFRTHYPWGLPGGWTERGEDPAETVRRELQEELLLRVEVKDLLLCKLQGKAPEDNVPYGLGLAFYCRLADGQFSSDTPAQAPYAYEVLSVKWVAPEEIEWKLAPLEREAIVLARAAFEHEQAGEESKTKTKDIKAILARTELIIRPGEFVLVGLEPAKRPGLEADLSGLKSDFCQYTVEPDVLTLLLEKAEWACLSHRYPEAKVEGPLRVFTFTVAMDWQVVGFLAAITGLLAQAGLPLGAVCGYYRDHLFIAVEHAARAEAILRAELERCRGESSA